MTSYIVDPKPLNKWDYSVIHAAPVGSIGDTRKQIRLKATYPGDFRWDESTAGQNESKRLGNFLTDGTYLSNGSGGGPARVYYSNWGGRRNFKVAHGWHYQDIRKPDTFIEPMMGAAPQYEWRNRLATLNKAVSLGDEFPIPNGWPISAPQGNLTRGGQYPRITDIAGEAGAPVGVNASESEINKVVMAYHPGGRQSTADQRKHHRAAIGERGPVGRRNLGRYDRRI